MRQKTSSAALLFLRLIFIFSEAVVYETHAADSSADDDDDRLLYNIRMTAEPSTTLPTLDIISHIISEVASKKTISEAKSSLIEKRRREFTRKSQQQEGMLMRVMLMRVMLMEGPLRHPFLMSQNYYSVVSCVLSHFVP